MELKLLEVGTALKLEVNSAAAWVGYSVVQMPAQVLGTLPPRSREYFRLRASSIKFPPKA